MTNSNRLLLGALLLAAASGMSSCADDATGQVEAAGGGATAESKLVFTSDNAVSGSLLVCFGEQAAAHVEAGVSRSGATRSGISDFDAVLDRIGVRSLHRLFPVDERSEHDLREAGLHRWYIVEFDESVDLDAAARAMADVAEVEHVEFNQQLTRIGGGDSRVDDDGGGMPPAATRAGDAPFDGPFDDPFLGRQWHYINTGNTAIYRNIRAGADVNCGEAWRICTGDPRIIVAVIDDCVNWEHLDLAANMWVNEREQTGSEGVDDDGNGYRDDVHGYNFVDNTPLSVSTTGDDASHGSHVAGTIAAVNNNGTGVCGIAGGSGRNDGVRIMSCQVYHDGRGGAGSMTAQAIRYAADNGASIISCSYGFDPKVCTSDMQYNQIDSAEKGAIDYFIQKVNNDAVSGGIVIFAAGNENYATSSYPGAYRDYISVTSMSCDYTPATYTNYGPGCNVAAPGGDATRGGASACIYSTLNDGYGYMQGTSMACPHVTGVAALGLSYAVQLGRHLTRDEYNAILLTSVNDINQYCTGNYARYKGAMGTGYIDAFQVLMNVRGITCIPIAAGSQQSIDIRQHLGSGDLGLTVSAVEISAEDRTRLGIASTPTVFGDKILIRCSNTGSAIMKVRLVAGTGNSSGINGMAITREFALVVRENISANGGWL